MGWSAISSFGLVLEMLDLLSVLWIGMAHQQSLILSKM